MYKVTAILPEEVRDYKHILEDTKDIYDMPRPYVECDEEEFYRNFEQGYLQYIQKRFVNITNIKHWTRTLIIYYFHNIAYGVLLPEVAQPNDKTLYYRIGCNHTNRTVENLGRCYNKYTCKNCGHTWRIDSSD